MDESVAAAAANVVRISNARDGFMNVQFSLLYRNGVFEGALL
jgi:hypothetical protein